MADPLRIGVVGTGGQAKVLIQNGAVLVNGQVETRRRRKLRRADIVEFEGETFTVFPSEESSPEADDE